MKGVRIKFICRSLVLTLFLFAGSASGGELRQFRLGEIWPDNNGVHINAHGGGMLYHEGVYYWFGEHKIEGEAGNKAHVGVHVYSSKDLYNWKDEGIALAVSDDPGSEIRKECIIERPKVIYNPRTKRFVMWFHLELKGRGYRAARSGVAVSDRVTGPYTYLGSARPNPGVGAENARDPQDLTVDRAIKHYVRDHEGGQMARDMTLFVDDDGKAYHLYSSEENMTLHLAELSEDYTRHSGRYVRLFPGRYHEAPTLFKRAGKYYMITSGCTGWSPNAARSAMADSIWGPWLELGNPCRGDAEQNKTTFHSQSTYVLPVSGKKDEFIYMGDRWRPQNAIDGRYVWLPIEWEGEKPVLKWHDRWDLSVFE